MSKIIKMAKAIPGFAPVFRAGRSVAIPLLSRAKRFATPGKLKGATKIHLGAGFRQMDGWANIDMAGPNIIWDLTKPLPIQPSSVAFAYSEHFIEHISRGDALKLFKNVRVALLPGGVLRLSTPDLAQIVSDYAGGNLISIPSHQWEPATLCQMVNEAMREWGHQFIYDESELTAMLNLSGFKSVVRVRRHESRQPELRNLETRPDMGDLILEAYV